MDGYLIPAWSFSTWSMFTKCKHRIYLDKVVKAEIEKILLEKADENYFRRAKKKEFRRLDH